MAKAKELQAVAEERVKSGLKWPLNRVLGAMFQKGKTQESEADVVRRNKNHNI